MRLSRRQREILRHIEDGAYVEVKDLAARLDVDVSTIRRDLQALVRNDLVLRLHGGVKLRPDGEPSAAGPSAARSAEEHHRAVASTARRMLRHGDSVALGAGPCTDVLVQYLFDLEDLTVVTNNIEAAQRLARHSQIRVLVAGGEIRAGDHAVTSGPDAADYLAAHPVRWLFLEVDGLHPFAGVTTAAPWRVSAYRAMLQAAERRCLLAQGSAFGARCVGLVADTDQVDLVVTDDSVADEDLPAFAGRVVRGVTDPLDDWRR
jgi:DeoR family transcriptional regulator of aga operon